MRIRYSWLCLAVVAILTQWSRAQTLWTIEAGPGPVGTTTYHEWQAPPAGCCFFLAPAGGTDHGYQEKDAWRPVHRGLPLVLRFVRKPR